MRKIFLSVLTAMIATVSFGQNQALPTDPNTRIGVLDNGLTYYIRHNELPENRAEFYIAQKVGAVLEEESQRGLAHFLEHMAFNGTANYPGKSMLDYLEKNGVKFGTNVNAYTGIDETVYMLLDVPTTNPGLVDSCLLVLHDWSSFISLEEEEIDKERGVILEELRSRDNADQRMLQKTLPIMYPNSNYGNRLPGGLPEVVANFEYQTLRDYYKKWYRPDLQGIIVVGDIDVDKIENRIKEMFADITLAEDATPRTYFPVEDNIEPIVAIASDPEASNYSLMVFYKHDAIPYEAKNSLEYFLLSYITNMVTTMSNYRYQDITKQAEPPFVYGYSYYGNYYVSPTKDAWTNVAMPKNADGIDEAMSTIIKENKRIQQYGFTNSEYERAKAEFMKNLDSQYAEREKQKNGHYVDECLDNFLHGEPMMGIENEYAMYSQLIPNIPLEAINSFTKELIRTDNIVICLNAPEIEGETLPTEEELIAIMDNANQEEVEPYEEFVSDEPILSELPKAGSVKKQKQLDIFDATEITLSNGIRVIIKPTDFKQDEILMTSYSLGGTSTMSLDDATTINVINELSTIGGLGNFSATDLPKVLAGKKVSVTPYIGNMTYGLRGSCSPKDLETMMQMMYLYLTDTRYDEEAFKSFITRYQAMLENMANDPMSTLQDSLSALLFDSHPFRASLKVDDIDEIDYKLALELYEQCFSNVSNFVFTFTGNINTEEFIPLAEQYLGSLPKSKGKAKYGDNVATITSGSANCIYDKAMSTPVTTILMAYSGKMDYTLENSVYMNAFSDIMDIIYTEKVREDEGGTYGVSTSGDIMSMPEKKYIFQIFFQTNAEIKDKLIGIIKDELDKMATEGPDPVILNKVKDYLVKHHQEQVKENRYWLNVIDSYYIDNLDNHSDYLEIVNGITAEKMRDFAKQVISNDLKELIQVGK